MECSKKVKKSRYCGKLITISNEMNRLFWTTLIQIWQEDIINHFVLLTKWLNISFTFQVFAIMWSMVRMLSERRYRRACTGSCFNFNWPSWHRCITWNSCPHWIYSRLIDAVLVDKICTVCIWRHSNVFTLLDKYHRVRMILIYGTIVGKVKNNLFLDLLNDTKA